MVILQVWTDLTMNLKLRVFHTFCEIFIKSKIIVLEPLEYNSINAYQVIQPTDRMFKGNSINAVFH